MPEHSVDEVVKLTAVYRKQDVVSNLQVPTITF